LTQHFMRDFDDEPALLAALRPLIERADGVVTFNGTTFDLPLLETRFILARRRWPAEAAPSGSDQAVTADVDVVLSPIVAGGRWSVR